MISIKKQKTALQWYHLAVEGNKMGLLGIVFGNNIRKG